METGEVVNLIDQPDWKCDCQYENYNFGVCKGYRVIEFIRV